MNPKSMLRRTLALLLVLIFALSNMGLAEMAEQIAAEIPAEEAPVEEVAADEADESASENLDEGGAAEEEAAPEDGDAAAEPEGEADADAVDPADEAEAPAEVPASELSVAITALDEHSLWAEVSGAEDGAELSYQWEVESTLDDGTVAWESVESDNEDAAIFSGALEDVAWNTYRVVVSSGETSVASEPALMDPSIFGVEVAQPEAEAIAEDSLDVAVFDDEGKGVTISPAAGQDKYVVYNANTYNTADADSIVLEAKAEQDEGGPDSNAFTDPTYTWGTVSESDADYISLTPSGTKGEQVIIKAKKAGADAGNAEKGLTVPIFCRVEDDGKVYSGTADVVVLPQLKQDAVEKALKLTYTNDEQKTTVVTEMPMSTTVKSFVVNVVLEGISAGYKVKYSGLYEKAVPPISTPAATHGPHWVEFKDATKGELTIHRRDGSDEDLDHQCTFTSANGQKIPIQVEVQNGGETITANTNLTLFPIADVTKVKLNGNGWGDAGSRNIPVNQESTLEIVYEPAVKVAEKAPGLKGLAHVKEIKLADADGTEIGLKQSGSDPQLYTFTPTTAGDYTLTLTTDAAHQWAGDNGEGKSNAQIRIQDIPSDFTIKVGDDDNAGPTETTKSFFVGEPESKNADADFELFLGKDFDGYTGGITWSISGNDYGKPGTTEEKYYLTFKDETDANEITEWPHKGGKKLVLQPIKDTIKRSGTITLTATAMVKPEGSSGATQPVEKTVTWTIKVLVPGSDVTPKDDNIVLSTEKIAQPIAYLSDGKAPAYATATASTTGLDNYKVTWSVDASEGAKTSENFWLEIDPGSGAIKAKVKSTAEDSKNVEFKATTGLEIPIKATVKKSKDAKDDVTISKKITVLPVPDTLTITNNGSTYADGSTVQVDAGTGKMTLTAAATAGGVTPAGVELWDHKIVASLTKLASAGSTDADGTPESIGVDQKTGEFELNFTEAGTYRLETQIMVGDAPVKNTPHIVTFDVKAVSQHVTLKQSPDTTVVYPGSTVTFTLETTTDDNYLGTPKWTLSATGIEGEVGTNWEDTLQNYSDGKKLCLTDTTSKKQVVNLVVPADFAGKFETGAKLTVHVTVPGSNLEPQDITFELQAKPTTNIKTLGKLTVPAYRAYDASGLYATDDKTIYIAQSDDSVTATYKADDTSKQTTLDDAIADGLKVRYSVLSKTATVKVADYLTIDPESGKITVKPEVKAGNGVTNANELTDADGLKTGKEFLVRYGIEGLDTNPNEDADSATAFVQQTIKIVAAPAGVKIVQVTDKGAVASSADVPKSTWVGNPVRVNAQLVPKAVTGALTAGKTPTLTATSSNYYTFQQETQGSKKDDFFTLTPSTTREPLSDLTATITASYPNLTAATKEITITFKNKNLKALNPNDKGCEDGGAVEKTHSWTVLATADDITKAITEYNLGSEYSLANGHYFKCGNGTCGAISQPVEHSKFDVVLTDDDKKKGLEAEDALWLTANGKVDHHTENGVTCSICNFKCTHDSTNYPKPGTVEYVDGTHHVAACSLCGKQIKQPHFNKSQELGICDVCEHTTANPTFSEEIATVVIGGKNYKPTLTVKDIEFYEIKYELDAGASQYITLVDEQTGEVAAKNVTPENVTATLLVKVTPLGDTTVKAAIGKLKFVVRNKVSGITINSDVQSMGDNKAYVIDSGAQKTIPVLHLKANVSPSAASADLRDYKWEIDKANVGNFQFVVKDSATDAWIKIAQGASVNGKTLTQEDVDKLLNATEIDLQLVEQTSTGITKPVPVFYHRAAGSTAAAEGDVEGKIEIEVLPTLKDGDFAGWITFNGVKPPVESSSSTFDAAKDQDSATGVKIIQGTSIPVSIVSAWKQDPNSTAAEGKYIVDKTFDERYGTVKFSVEAVDISTSGADKTALDGKTMAVSSGQRANWINITGANGSTASVSAPKASSQNKLESPFAAAFKVRATVTLPWNNPADNKPATVSSYRYVWVVGNTAKAKFQYKTAQGAWADVTADGVNADEGDEVQLRLYVTNEADSSGSKAKPGIDANAFIWGEVAAANGELTAVVGGDPVTDKLASAITKNVKIAKSGAADSFDVTASYPGIPEVKAKINVKRLIKSLSLDADISAIGAGETRKSGAVETKVTKVTLTATVDPETTGDTLDWIVTDKEGNAAIKDVVLQKVENNKYQMAFSVKDTREDKVEDIGPEVVITVSAEKTKGEDGLPLSASKTIMYYQNPTKAGNNGADALELAPAKAKGNGRGGALSDLYLTVGESTEITAGWVKDSGFGASENVSFTKLAARNDEPDDESDAGKPIVSFSNGNVVKGETMGTTEIWIHPVGYSTEVDKIEQKLTVRVTEAANLIKVADSAKFKTSYTIVANQPEEKREKIDKSWLKAYRRKTDAETSQVQETEAPEAAVILKSDDETILKIVESKDKTQWELLGVAPGTANIYGYLNDETDTLQTLKIPVTVQAPVEGIVFKQNGIALPTNTQLRTSLEKPETFTLTAEKVPKYAVGDVSIKVDKPDIVGMEQTDLTVTLTPKAAGTAEVTAKVENPNWVAGGNSLLNPQYLTARVEILVTETEQGGGTVTPGGEIGTQIVGKAAIGPKEYTQIAATGVGSVTWTVEPATAVTTKENLNDHSIKITSNGTADGKVVVTAMSGNAVIGSQTIYLLSEIEEVALSRGKSLTMAIGEVLPLEAEIVSGYDFKSGALATEAQAAGVEIDYSNLFTYTSNLPAKLAVTGENEKFSVKAVAKPGKKDPVPVLTVHAGTKTADVPVTINSKNKSFNIGDINGGTLYMAPGQKKTITIKSSPENSPANLIYVIKDEDGYAYEDVVPGQLSISKTATTGVIEIDAGADTAKYSITVKAEGYTNHADQSFTLIVEDEVSEGAQIAVIKAGMPVDNDNKPLYGNVSVVKGEKLQAVIVDANGEIVGGDMTFAQTKSEKKVAQATSTGLITTKKTGNVQIAPTVTNAAGTSVSVKPLALTVIAAPKGKIALDPTDKTRTVALGEKFKLALTGVTYPGTKPEGSAGKWYTISATADLNLTDESDEENPNTYSFGSTGTTTLTLKPIWGGTAKTVKFTVVAPAAEEFSVPEEVKVAAGTKTIVTANMDGYANLTWKANAGATVIGTKDVAVNADKSIKVKKLDNSTIQITTTKKAAGEATLTVSGCDTEYEMKIVVTAPATAFPEGTTLEFDKKVITVGEKTTAILNYNGEEAPAGAITYKFVSVKGAGKASVKNNVITGKAKGVVTIEARIGGKNGGSVRGTLYVVDKATIRTAVNPTKMGAGEMLAVDVTLVNYDSNHVLDANFKDEINTEGMLSVETSNSQITAWIAHPDDEVPNKYTLMLWAHDAVKSKSGKYQKTTVTLRLSNGQRKVMKIQVVEPAEEASVYVHRKVTLAPGTSVKLQTAIAQGTSYGANYSWHFASEEDEALAETKGLTLADGKLTAAKKAAPTAADEPIMIEGGYGSSVAEVEVVIAAAKAKKGQFRIVTPNRKYAFIGEHILGEVEYNAGVGGGDVKWKSSKSKVITVDKATGLFTVVGPVGKKSVISATSNGKAAAAKVELLVQDAPKSVSFSAADIILPAAGTNLTNLVSIDGTSLSGGNYSGAIRFTTDSEDFNLDPGTGVITAKPGVENASAFVRVTTFNGMTADILVVVGEGGGSVGPVDPEDKTPASIELYLNNQSINNQTVELMEGGEGITPEVKVKNAAGAVIESATVSWQSSDDTKASVAANGAVTPLAHTLSSTGTAHDHDPVTITASVSGTNAQASYKVQVNPNLAKASNFKFQLTGKIGTKSSVMESLLVGDGSAKSTVTKVTGSVVLTIPNTKFDTVVDKSSIKVKILDEKKLGKGTDWTNEQPDTQNEFPLVALAAGEAQITVELTLLNGTKLTFPQTIMIDELPGKDSMKIVDKDGKEITGMKLGDTETGEFHIQMASGFKGMPTGGDIDVVVYETSDANKTNLTKDSGPTFNEGTDPKDASKHTLAKKTGGLTEVKKYTVVATAYKQRYTNITPAQEANLPTASFELEVAPKPTYADYDVTGSLDLQGGGQNYTLDLGMGESVTITAAQKETSKSYWSKGIKWVESTEYTNAADEIHATVTPNGESVQVTYDDPKATKERKIKVDLVLEDDGTNTLTTVTISFHPLPSKKDGGNYDSSIAAYDAENKKPVTDAADLTNKTVTVGVNESFSVYVKFMTDTAVGYTSNVRWAASSEFFDVKPNGVSCTLTAKKMTQAKDAEQLSTVNVDAFYGAGDDVPLGSFKVTILDKPASVLDLVLKEMVGKEEQDFDNKLSTTSHGSEEDAITLKAVLGKGISANLSLTCENNCVVVKPDDKNQWKLWYTTEENPVTGKTPSPEEQGATEFALVLSDPANKLYKNINLKLDTAGKATLSGNDTVTSAEIPDPSTSYPEGLKSDDPTRGCSAEKLEQNQSAVVVTVSGTDTFKLGADLTKMADWKTTEEPDPEKATPGVDDQNYKWFCLIIDTGDITVTDDFYYRMHYDEPNGAGTYANGVSDWQKAGSDMKAYDAWESAGATEKCITLWLQLDYWAGYKLKYEVSKDNKGTSAKTFYVDLTGVTPWYLD